jgi:hypothetical protein
MPYESLTAPRDDIDTKIESFASGVTSIDAISVAGHGHNQVTAVLEYTA